MPLLPLFYPKRTTLCLHNTPRRTELLPFKINGAIPGWLVWPFLWWFWMACVLLSQKVPWDALWTSHLTVQSLVSAQSNSHFSQQKEVTPFSLQLISSPSSRGKHFRTIQVSCPTSTFPFPTPVLEYLILEKLRQGGHEFKASLGYIVSYVRWRKRQKG